MGELREITNVKTPAELAKKEGVSVDAIRARWKAEFREVPFDRNRAISPEQMAKISREITRNEPAKSSPRSAKKAKRVNSTIPPAPGANVLPAADPKPRKTFRESMDTFRAFALDAILVSVVAGHALLIWYDCAIQWGTPGTIGGGLAFAIVLAALLLATDETRARTSGAALYFVLCVDIAAWWVHFPTFQRPGVPDEITGVFAGFLCAASWVALYLYRDKNID